ncbi:MAG: hypothetical protein R2778_08465 [Saprospiraceae bacterium]
MVAGKLQQFGDCIVQYDHDAERWIIMELRSINSNELLVAISNSSDPTGSWKAYRIQTLDFRIIPNYMYGTTPISLQLMSS